MINPVQIIGQLTHLIKTRIIRRPLQRWRYAVYVLCLEIKEMAKRCAVGQSIPPVVATPGQNTAFASYVYPFCLHTTNTTHRAGTNLTALKHHFLSVLPMPSAQHGRVYIQFQDSIPTYGSSPRNTSMLLVMCKKKNQNC